METLVFLITEHFNVVLTVLLVLMLTGFIFLRRYGQHENFRLTMYMIEIFLLFSVCLLLAFYEQLHNRNTKDDVSACNVSSSEYFTYEYGYYNDEDFRDQTPEAFSAVPGRR